MTGYAEGVERDGFAAVDRAVDQGTVDALLAGLRDAADSGGDEAGTSLRTIFPAGWSGTAAGEQGGADAITRRPPRISCLCAEEDGVPPRISRELRSGDDARPCISRAVRLSARPPFIYRPSLIRRIARARWHGRERRRSFSVVRH
jgi:hypothetical protein